MIDDAMLDRLIEAVNAAGDDAPLDGTPYEIREEIGRGGMGIVYRAWDAKLEREVALKVTDGSDDVPEARIAASLEHPGIVPVYDAGRLADGRGFCAMRLVRGLPLDRYIAAKAPPVSARIAIFQKICEAAAFAHSRGVIHRDLKPANIMVGSFGEVAVLDWGVADRPARTSPSAASMVVGTPNFMSPEQAAARPATPLADVYSLGAVLQFLLPPNAPGALSAIAAKAMRASPAERYQDVPALSADLGRYLDGLAVEAHRESLAERATRFGRRNRTLLLLVGAYFVVRIAIYFFSGR